MISHLITSKILALIVLFGLTSCFQCPDDESSYSRYFQKESDDEYLICFERDITNEGYYFSKPDTVLKQTHIEERVAGLVLSKELDNKPKEAITKYLLQKNLEWIETIERLDSIGIYLMSNDSLLAMMYSKKIEKEYNLKSSTKYTNPFLEDNWTVIFDEKEYKKRRGGLIATVTYTLKKLE